MKFNSAAGEFVPDWAVPPGALLKAELEEQHMTQADLAARTGLSAKHVNQVVKGVVPLSPEVALLLERTLGVPSRLWNAAEADYRDHVTRSAATQSLVDHASWAKDFPLADLRQRGVLQPHSPGEPVALTLLRFFGVASPSAWQAVYAQASFRRAQHTKVSVENTTAWLRLAELRALELAGRLRPPAYSAKALRALLPRLRRLTLQSDDAAALSEAQRLCASAGVLVVFVPTLPHTGAQGATRWLGDVPIVAVTERYKQHDIFWFSLFHELSHVLLHPKRGSYVSRKDGDDADGLEQEANDHAADLLIPPAYIARLQAAGPDDAPRLADELDVAVSIVAGRMARAHGQWSRYACYRRALDIDVLVRALDH